MRILVAFAITLGAAIGLGGCFWHHQAAVVTQPLPPPLKRSNWARSDFTPQVVSRFLRRGYSHKSAIGLFADTDVTTAWMGPFWSSFIGQGVGCGCSNPTRSLR